MVWFISNLNKAGRGQYTLSRNSSSSALNDENGTSKYWNQEFGQEGGQRVATISAGGQLAGPPPPPATAGEHGRAETVGKISEWQAGWNVTNAIQGMSLVSLPYAVKHGGYIGLLSLILISYICCHTGKILIDCLYERDEKSGEIVRCRSSYLDIARVCFGHRLAKLVDVAQVLELLMTCILYVVLCGDLLESTFPDGIIDMRSWMLLCGVILIPCALLKNLHSVSLLSFYCTLIHFVINAIIVAYCSAQFSSWQWTRVSYSINLSTFPICLGIVVFSYTSQIFLPNLEGNMRRPENFDRMLDSTHIIAAICKSAFAYVGFLTFGDNTDEIIANNLPTRGLREMVNLALVIKALLSYPLPYYAAANLIETTLLRGLWTQQASPGSWAVGFRGALVLVTILVAITVPHFALLVGFIGSFTGTMLSIIWPCLFHMQLRWNELSTATISWEILLICLGVFFGITGMWTSLVGLVEVVSAEAD